MSKLEEYGLEVSFYIYRNPITQKESYHHYFNYSSSNHSQGFLYELSVVFGQLQYSDIDEFVEELEYLRDYEPVDPGYIHEIIWPVQYFYIVNYHASSKMLSFDYMGDPTIIPIQDLIDVLKESKIILEKNQ